MGYINPLITSVFLASLALARSSLPPRSGGPAPLIKPRGAELIPDKYIVKLSEDEGSPNAYDGVISLFIAETDAVYDMTGFRGFAGALDLNAVESLRNHPGVEYIEQDAEVRACASVTQANSPWGLSRISHRRRDNSSSSNSSNTDYIYDDSAGAGTCTYIVDTGIYTQHVEFECRASNIFDSTGVSDGDDPSDIGDGDGNGHGTHVAGIAGSKAYGVAKKTRLFGVKVLDGSGSGTTSGVIQGLSFVAADAKTRISGGSCPNGTVANISLAGSYSAALNAAAAALVGSGVFVAVSSGGNNDDTARYSPASEPSGCTVGASDELDRMTPYSNWGSRVDIYAPGSNILSTWNTGPSSTNVLSGTSMATAYVSGLGAYLLALEGPRDGISLCKRIQKLSTENVLGKVPVGTNNYLAFNGNPFG